MDPTPLLAAPLVMIVASAGERRFGPSVAGLLAAAPISIALVLLDVGWAQGPDVAGTLALNAAAHLSAQIAFAIVFSRVMAVSGTGRGLLCGTLAFLAVSVPIAFLPTGVAIAAGALTLVAAWHALPASDCQSAFEPDARMLALRIVLGTAFVAGILMTTRVAGPAVAGGISAFPAISATLATMIARARGSRAGTNSLRGLIRGLAGYLAFCLTVAAAAGSVGITLAVVVAWAASAAIGVTAFQAARRTAAQLAS